jgi:hypothetical protein
MRRIAFVLGAVGALASAAAYMAPASGQADGEAAPIYGVKIPPGYRDWQLISVNHLGGGNFKQVRAQLGNDIAIKAFREGKLPFPDGTIIVALHWTETPSGENNKVLAVGFPGAGLQSFVAGPAENIQFMVKNSRKYAATGGWGFADFKDGKPASEAVHKTCFSCHEPANDRDHVFTRYAR